MPPSKPRRRGWKLGDPLLSTENDRYLEEEFWPHVKKGPRCWEWTGGMDTWGYGRVVLSPFLGFEKAHRLAWIFTFGSIPKGLYVLHACDNKLCCRPDHLMLGTARANAIDSVVKRGYDYKNEKKTKRSRERKWKRKTAEKLQRQES